MQDTYLDVSCIKAIHAWKHEDTLDGNVQMSEPEQLPAGIHPVLLSPFKSKRPSRLRRRICRSRSSHQNKRHKSSFRIGCDGKLRQIRHDFSDNEAIGFSSESGSVGKGDDAGNFMHGRNTWQRQNKHQPFSKRIRSFKSTSSIQSSGNWSMKTDSAVDFIHKITSSRALSSEKKLQFVSDLLLTMDDEEEDDDEGEDYADDYNVLGDTLFVPRQKEVTPAETISELTGRLCKSLDNILDDDIRTDQRSIHSHQGTKSLSSIHAVDSEVQLWKKIESRSASIKSVHLEDVDFSSKSEESLEDVDDSAPLEVLQRNKPMRQNIRRKRYVYLCKNRTLGNIIETTHVIIVLK